MADTSNRLEELEAVALPAHEVDGRPIDELEVPIVAMLMRDPELFKQYRHLLTPQLFSHPICYAILTILQDPDFVDVPSVGIIRYELNKHLPPDFDTRQVEAVFSAAVNPGDRQYLVKNLNSIIQHKKYLRLLDEETVEAIHLGQFDVVDRILTEARTAVLEENTGRFVSPEMVVANLKEAARVKVPTGIKGLDTLLNNGGPSPGEVLCFIAKTNGGKTSLMCNAAANYIRNGYDVAYFCAEETISSIEKKILCSLTGQPVTEIEADPTRGLEKLQACKGRLYVQKFDSYTWTTQHLDATLTRLDAVHHFRPKVIIIDYLDCLRSKTKAEAEYQIQRYVASELSNVATAHDTMVMTATQGNRQAVTAANISLDMLSESYGKAMPCHYMVSINQDEKDVFQNRLRLYIAKNRNGPVGKTVYCNVKWSCCRIWEV